jgi:hypothetical protein
VSRKRRLHRMRMLEVELSHHDSGDTILVLLQEGTGFEEGKRMVMEQKRLG